MSWGVMTSKKSIFGDEQQELPDTAYVSLTEAITWIAVGDCRDDDFIDEWIRFKATQNIEQWQSEDGPEWMLPHLELIEDGKTWEDVPEKAGRHLLGMMNGLRNVESWLEKTGLDLEVAIKEVVAAVEADFEVEEPIHRAMELIWKSCADEDVKLEGMRYDTQSRRATSGEHETIPYRYFVRPVHYFQGRTSRLGKGLLCGEPADTDEELFEQISGRTDKRPDYIGVMARRDDVLMLEKRFNKQSDAARNRRGGRPDAYDWPRFTAEAIQVLEEEGEPGFDPEWASLAHLERRMTDWCDEKWGLIPAESTIRKRCIVALKEFRQKRKAEN